MTPESAAGRLLKPLRERPVEALLLGAGFALRAGGLGLRSLWFDEAKTLIIATAPWGGIVPLVKDLEGIPPPYYWLLHVWTSLFADPLLAVRVFSCLCGAASLALFARLARRTLQKEWLLALLIACFSSYWIHAAQDGRVYALFQLACLAQCAAMLSLRETWSRRGLAVYAAAGLAGLYLHPFFGFLLLPHFLYGWVRHPGRRLPWVLAHAAMAAAFLPWLPGLRAQMARPDTSILKEPLTAGQLCYIVSTMLVDLPFLTLAFPSWVRTLGALSLALLAGAWVDLWRTERRPRARELAAFLACQLALSLGAVRLTEAVLGRPVSQPRYFVLFSPYLYLALGQALGRPGRAWLKGARAALAAVVVAGAAGYYWSGRVVDPHLEALSARLRRLSDGRAPIVHLHSFHYPALRYYYLPERTHFILCSDPHGMVWGALPGYPARIEAERLVPFERVVIVDPERRLAPTGFGLATGPQAAAIACP